MKDPTVSIIIPSFNRAHLLPKTIPQYVQKHVCEIIIIDDNSTDNTEEVVNNLMIEIPILKYYKSLKKIRQTGAKNIGISLALGDYCFFDDDDNILKEGSIESLVQTAQIKGDAIIGARHYFMNKNESLEELLLDASVMPNFDIKLFFNKNNLHLNVYPRLTDVVELPLCHACFLIPTKIAKSQQFNESLLGTCNKEETDYIMQLCSKGYKVYLDCNALSIDLPREISTGGIRSVSVIKRHIFESYNEFVFFKRNRTYIKTISTMNTNPYFRAFMHFAEKILRIIWLK